MAECILLNGGGFIDETMLTSTPQDVRNGKTFYGSGTDQIQAGQLAEVPAQTYNLPLNGRQAIPKGIHNGNVVVRQTGIAVFNGETVYPTDQPKTVATANKYAAQDIYVAPLTGLSPENIKKDVVILGVKGTYEGYE